MAWQEARGLWGFSEKTSPPEAGQAGRLGTKEKSHDPQKCKQYVALLSNYAKRIVQTIQSYLIRGGFIDPSNKTLDSSG
jgi:hypothetical protein